MLKDVSLGAMSIFTWLLAVLATAMLLPKDIEDRTLYTILAKPVPRFEYLLGKFLGVLAAALRRAVAHERGLRGRALHARAERARGDHARRCRTELLGRRARGRSRRSTFNSNLLPGIVIIYLKAALCAALTLLLSTFASSSIFTIIISVVVYLIGHIQPIAREDWLASARRVASADQDLPRARRAALPGSQAFNLVDDIVVGNADAALLFREDGRPRRDLHLRLFPRRLLHVRRQGTMNRRVAHRRSLMLLAFGAAQAALRAPARRRASRGLFPRREARPRACASRSARWAFSRR